MSRCILGKWILIWLELVEDHVQWWILVLCTCRPAFMHITNI